MRLLLVLCCAGAALLLPACGGDDKADEPKPPPVVSTPADADSDSADEQEEPEEDVAASAPVFPAIATKNTTRVGGENAIADAAGAALAVFPGQAADSRPTVVSIVDVSDWQVIISAAQLMARPLRAPILLSEDGKLPTVSKAALDLLRPSGAKEAGGDAALKLGGKAAAPPSDLESAQISGDDAAAIARRIDRLAEAAAGKPTREVIVAGSKQPAYAMPAAGLAAKTGAPVLWVDGDTLPPSTVSAIETRKKPRIYVIGPKEAVSEAAVKRLRKLGTVERIDGEDPVSNAVAVARYSDGNFGWNAVDPGHGLTFASTERTADAAAAAMLAGAGKYGPLLLVDKADELDKPVENYLLDIQPGYDKDPVRGVYNHGWILGGEDVLSVPVQARIDSLLEIQPVSGG